eukprot:1795617-Rhodomonas_salina.1
MSRWMMPAVCRCETPWYKTDPKSVPHATPPGTTPTCAQYQNTSWYNTGHSSVPLCLVAHCPTSVPAGSTALSRLSTSCVGR